MKEFYLILYCCFFFLPIFHGVTSLRCRTGNQQSDGQLQKIMQVCRRRYLGYDRSNNGGRDHYRDTDSQESSSSSDSDSDEDTFDNKFLSGGGYSRGYNSMNNNNRNNMGSSRSGTMMHRSNGSGRSGSYSMNNNDSRSSYGNQGSYSNQRRNSNNGRGGMQSYDNRNSYSNNNMNNRNNYNNNYDDMNNNNEGERERACVIQCFFSELNMVDQRGFPERSAVIGLMIQNIQDPELRDFVEESVVECYHYLSNMGRLEKCQFSQNLLSCLAEKGSERCDDWNDN